ncbi:TonB-linked outer membrane protein, SusC/RagA family [Porphyromonas cangingivalis]|uniref:SusC/RagA family TonB-linked outer membrane protein n=1 Tax=Porphyromonas cangingivalis TaxID=36874 RepID=UPI000D811752|nr:SusC/RagA family TonB-linked outer membrane protein [Porphyromonas cangingivalis]SPY35326.1 TonB-linked outer membrane protein, SusC/RagA family [Porphyromonas cangingivalis]
MRVNHNVLGQVTFVVSVAMVSAMGLLQARAAVYPEGSPSGLIREVSTSHERLIPESQQPQQPKGRALVGKVLDETKAPLPGAAIRIKGVKGGASAKVDGSFTISIPQGLKEVIVEVSYIGMEKRSVKYTGQEPFVIVLKEEKNELSEVVITGYQKLKKNSFTGNATIVTKDQLLKTNNKNAIAALQTFEPSFRIKEANTWGSDPNRLPDFSIRGESSLSTSRGIDAENARRNQRTGLKDNPNLPIFILDGFEVSVQKIYDMDMNRIESMTILKDAAATALYGSRAANGVVVVTTVPPQPGEIRVNYNLTGGIELPDLSDYNLANAEEMLEIEKLSGEYTSFDGDPSVQLDHDLKWNNLVNEVRRGVRTDWLAQPLRNAFNQTHSVNISGGVESIRYGLDLTYNTHNGAMKGSYRDNYAAALTLDYRLGSKMQIMNQISYGLTKNEDSPFGSFDAYAKFKPYWTPYDNDHNLVKKINGETNPLYSERFLGNYSGRGNLQDFTNNTSVNMYFSDSFYFKGQFSITQTKHNTESFLDPKDPKYSGETDSTKKGFLSTSFASTLNWNLNAMLYYNKKFGEHFVNATFGTNIQETNNRNLSVSYSGFQLSNLNSPAYAAKQIDTKTPQTFAQTRLLGLLGALNYSYKDIYIADASFRFDGSSRFGRNKRFAPFWSVGVGVNFHKYDFLKDNPYVSLLRIRSTYGQVGNVNFPPYAAISTYRTAPYWYAGIPANTLIALGNPGMTWEKTNTLDLGISIGLFKDRLTLEANYYRKETNDQISQLNIRTSSGFETYHTNAGSILNTGYEFRLNAVPYQDRDWRVAINATMAANKNRVTSLGQEAEQYNKNIQDFHNGKLKIDSKGSEKAKNDYEKLMFIPLTQYYVGASTTAIYAVRSLGIDPSSGRELFLKRDGTPTYIWDAVDQLVVGDTSPKAQGAFSINVGWKRFYVNANFLYQFGGQQYNETLLQKVEHAEIRVGNVDRRVLLDRWKKPGDVVPFYDIALQIKTQPTSRYVQNNNYLAFSGFSAGYDFGSEVTQKLHLTSLGIRFNANEITRWSTIRQERGTSYPYAKNYSFTLTLGI